MCVTVLVMEIHPDALRVIRERSGFTQTGLAAAAGIKQAHVSNMEAGRRKASPDVIVALASALAVPVTAIIKNPPEKAAAA